MKQKQKFNPTGTYLWGLIIAMGLILSFSEKPRYTLSLDADELNTLWYVIDQSNAEHAAVRRIQALISEQIRPQVDSLQKKAATQDSTSSPKNKKP